MLDESIGVLRSPNPDDPNEVEETAHLLWNASETSDAIRGLSHWFGSERWQGGGGLEQLGRLHVGMFMKLCSLAEKPLWEMKSMLEWGPGGGANAVAFASHMERFVGVDISAANLEECIRQFSNRGLLAKTAFSPIIIDISDPETALLTLGDKVDFFLSTAVYQHFPSMQYGERVTRIANRALKPGGLAIIQIRLNDGTAGFQSKTADYAHEFLSFTCYTLEEFDNAAKECGFEPLDRVLQDDVNYVYYFLKKIREIDLSA